MRTLLCVIAVIMASPAPASPSTDVIGPHIDLRVEQPAFAGMPVWLEVEADDFCLNEPYTGDTTVVAWPNEGFQPFGARAEIRGPDGQTPPPARPDAGKPTSWRMPSLVLPRYRPSDHAPALRNSGPVHRFTARVCNVGPETGHRMKTRYPLHLQANLQPGIYQVRWVIPGPAQGRRQAIIARSDWLRFTVTASTPAQRDAWLIPALAHPPARPDTAGLEYVPALLAAWNGPRVLRRLLDLTCEPNNWITGPAATALPGDLGPDGQRYLAGLIRGGCLNGGLLGYVKRTDFYGSVYNDNISQETARAIKSAVLDRLRSGASTDTALALRIVSALTPPAPYGSDADPEYFALAPEIIAGNDDAAKEVLANYLSRRQAAPAVPGLLRKLAAQDNRASEIALGGLLQENAPGLRDFLKTLAVTGTRTKGQALAGLVVLGYQDDLPPITARLASADTSLSPQQVTDVIEWMSYAIRGVYTPGNHQSATPQFIAATKQALLALMSQARTALVRDDAAMALAALDVTDARRTILHVLQTGTADEVAHIVETMCRFSWDKPCYDSVAGSYPVVLPGQTADLPAQDAQRRAAAIAYYAAKP